MRYRRSQRLVQPGLQLRFGLAVSAIALSSVLLQSLLLRWSFAEVLSSTTGGVWIEDPDRFLALHALATGALVLPLGLVIGALALFPFVGPLHRMERHLQRFLDGDDPGECRLRKGDRLVSLCVLLNRVLERARGGVEGAEPPQEDLLEETPAALPREGAAEPESVA